MRQARPLQGLFCSSFADQHHDYKNQIKYNNGLSFPAEQQNCNIICLSFFLCRVAGENAIPSSASFLDWIISIILRGNDRMVNE